MQDLFITKPVKVSRDVKTLKIEDEKIKKIPVSLIRSVYLFGNVELSQSARNLLLEYSKDIYYFSSKGEFKGVLHNSKLNSNYKNRLLQYKNIYNLEISKFIVNKKIETIEEYTQKSLKRYKDKLNNVNSLNEILGVEGSASVYMFNKVREELAEHSIEFTKREYKPVKDRVNGLFSFVYTLYYQFLHTIILSEGFDPYIGMLHRKRGKHMAFVSDVMEGYRAILTAFVVKLLKEKLIVEDDFDELFLNYEGRKKFISYYLSLLEELNHKEFLDEIKNKLI